MPRIGEVAATKIHEYQQTHSLYTVTEISKALGYDDETVRDVLLGKTYQEVFKKFHPAKEIELDLSRSKIIAIREVTNKLVKGVSEYFELDSNKRNQILERTNTLLIEILHEKLEKEVMELKTLKHLAAEKQQKLKETLVKIEEEQARIDSVLSLIGDNK